MLWGSDAVSMQRGKGLAFPPTSQSCRWAPRLAPGHVLQLRSIKYSSILKGTDREAEGTVDPASSIPGLSAELQASSLSSLASWPRLALPDLALTRLPGEVGAGPPEAEDSPHPAPGDLCSPVPDWDYREPWGRERECGCLLLSAARHSCCGLGRPSR